MFSTRALYEAVDGSSVECSYRIRAFLAKGNHALTAPALFAPSNLHFSSYSCANVFRGIEAAASLKHKIRMGMVGQYLFFDHRFASRCVSRLHFGSQPVLGPRFFVLKYGKSGGDVSAWSCARWRRRKPRRTQLTG